jgi:hypothetical protein
VQRSARDRPLSRFLPYGPPRGLRAAITRRSPLRRFSSVRALGSPDTVIVCVYPDSIIACQGVRRTRKLCRAPQRSITRSRPPCFPARRRFSGQYCGASRSVCDPSTSRIRHANALSPGTIRSRAGALRRSATLLRLLPSVSPQPNLSTRVCGRILPRGLLGR